MYFISYFNLVIATAFLERQPEIVTNFQTSFVLDKRMQHAKTEFNCSAYSTVICAVYLYSKALSHSRSLTLACVPPLSRLNRRTQLRRFRALLLSFSKT